MDYKNIISAKLAQLEPSRLEIIDESEKHEGHAGYKAGGNSHFKIIISSTAFTDKPLLQCHKMIYKILEQEMQEQIHALTIIIR